MSQPPATIVAGRPLVSRRRLPIGAEPHDDGTVSFRVWAAACSSVSVVVGSDGSFLELQLEAEPGGYFSAVTEAVSVGNLYRFRLDGSRDLFPDPASRFQPEGPEGPSQIVDPTTFTWSDGSWKGPEPSREVIYELHVGTFTADGTWTAALEHLPRLAELGVTIIEVMPVAEFPGRFGWGYDGVNLFAPTHLYGTPDDFRRFVDGAHAHGLAVILDVVYNHLGPSGNYLPRFSPSYFSATHKTEWGDALNFDGVDSRPVREFFIANAGYWIDEFHLDGLRLDATQQIFDSSAEQIVCAVARRVREVAGGRRTFVVAENERQDAKLARPRDQGGSGLDALWNDDFHHSARVAVTGRHEAYYSDYRGRAQELLSATKWGFLYQGQRSQWQGGGRGYPAFDLGHGAFVHFLENHDQVANSADGARVCTMASPGAYRAITALLLLGPAIPMLFQGQEFGSTTPFLYFADHEPALAEAVRTGRRTFLSQFPSIAEPAVTAQLADPGDPATFKRCRLDYGEAARNVEAYTLHRDLLRLRREDPAFAEPRHRGVDGAVLARNAFVLRYLRGDATERLLIVNLGPDVPLGPVPEPLLAPPVGMHWTTIWSSEDPRYGGSGMPEVVTDQGWRFSGNSAVVLAPIPIGSDESAVTEADPVVEGVSTVASTNGNVRS